LINSSIWHILEANLVKSKLNDGSVRNRDLKDDDDDDTFNPTDCKTGDGPPKNIKTSNTSSEIGVISQSLLPIQRTRI
jgi:hypothetical protein